MPHDSDATGFDSAAVSSQTQLDTLNAEKTTIKGNITTATTNRTNAISDISTSNTSRNDRYNEISNTAKTDSEYDGKVTTANNNYDTSLSDMNNLDAFSGDHVTQNDS